MKRAWGALLVIALAGCPAGGAKDVEAPVVDSRTATKGARELMKELYDNVRRGGTDGLQPLVDAALVTVGPGPNDIFVERTEALLALATALPPGKKYKLVSTDLEVRASPGGHAAWASDVITLDGAKYSLGVVMTEADELWTIAAIQIGIPIAKKDLRPKKLAPPVPVPAPADPAKPLIDLFKAGAADPLVLQDQLANRPSTVVRDTTGRALVGKKAIKKAWKKEMKGVVTVPRAEGVHARIAPDGTLGWAIGSVDVTVKKEPTLPTRMFHVYEKTEDGWQVVLAQPTLTPAKR
jgi:hypothetical protein